MKQLVLGTAAIVMAMSVPAASAAQKEGRQNASVELSVVGAEGQRVQLDSLPEVDRRRIVSLRNSMQQWGNQQSQRVTITISCKFNPFNCTITVAW